MAMFLQKPSNPPIAVESVFVSFAEKYRSQESQLSVFHLKRCVENGPFVDHAPLKHGDVPAMSSSQLGSSNPSVIPIKLD